MEFGLATADAHGVAAIRTHLDSHERQAEITWDEFSQVRERWKDHITLQDGGLLGGVTRASGGTRGSGLEDIDALFDRLLILAGERELDIDLHVDEAAHADALPHVACATIRHGFEGRVTCGHCCSLALLSDDVLRDRIALIADAGLSIITLPTVNMYRQNREPGRTPRWRGVTPVQDLQASKITVATAGDNCRDPFIAYGDHDMLETWRQTVRILHLDRPCADATALAGPAPAKIIGTERPADLMILEAWSLDQAIARPHADRVVLRRGVFANCTLPSYCLLGGPDDG